MHRVKKKRVGEEPSPWAIRRVRVSRHFWLGRRNLRGEWEASVTGLHETGRLWDQLLSLFSTGHRSWQGTGALVIQMLNGLASFFLIACPLLWKTEKMPLHFKIKWYALVCPGECGRTKANQIGDSHIVNEARAWRWTTWLLPWHFKGMTRSNLNDRISIYFYSSFDCYPRFYLWAWKLSIHLKTKAKPWPHKDCLSRDCFCKLKKKPHVLQRTRGSHFAGDQKDWVMISIMKTRAKRLVQSRTTDFSASSILTFPGKTNTSGIKTPREGGFE